MKKNMMVILAVLILLLNTACESSVSDNTDNNGAPPPSNNVTLPASDSAQGEINTTPSTSMGQLFFVPGVYGACLVNDGEAYAWGECCHFFSAKYYDTDYVSAFIRIAEDIPDIKQILPFYGAYSLILTKNGDVFGSLGGWGLLQMSERERASFWESIENLSEQEQMEKALKFVKLNSLRGIEELFFSRMLEQVETADDFYRASIYAISRDGDVFGLGVLRWERIDDESGAVIFSEEPFITKIENAPRIKKITENHGTRIFLMTDGKVYSLGSNEEGRLGNGSDVDFSTKLVQVNGLNNVVDIAGDAYDTAYALTADGIVYAWGNNYRSQFGTGNNELDFSNIPVDIGLTDIKKIFCGFMFNESSAGLLVAIGGKGSVYAPPIWEGWSTGWSYHSGYVQVPGISQAKDITIYENDNIYILTDDGSVYAFGEGESGNRYGQMGNGSTSATKSRVKVEGLPPIAKIYAHQGSVFAVSEDGDLYAWGNNKNGQLGIGKATEDYQSRESEWGYTVYDAFELRPVKIDGLTLFGG